MSDEEFIEVKESLEDIIVLKKQAWNLDWK